MTEQQRILLVEDEEKWRKDLKNGLEAIGLAVTSYGKSKQALDHFQANPYAYRLILMDWVMPPPVTGEYFLSEVRKVNAYLPVLVITGDAEGVGKQAVQAGATNYFRKRADLSELIAAIRELIGQDMLFHNIAENFTDLLSADSCLFYRYLPREEQLKLEAWIGEPAPQVNHLDGI